MHMKFGFGLRRAVGMADRIDLRGLADDALLCLGFFTRLPLPKTAITRSFAGSLWAAPLVGVVVGLIVGIVFASMLGFGVPAGVAAGLAMAVGVLATGALHEDGLADTADGFGGGRDRAAKLAIMRDSRIGTYGVLAIGLSLLIRWAALIAIAALPAFDLVLVVIAAHAASRALLPGFLALVQPARTEGLSAGVGEVETRTAVIALGIGAVVLLVSPAPFILVAVLLAIIFIGLSRLCNAQIGGQTGDVLGALQQVGEAAILVAAASVFGVS